MECNFLKMQFGDLDDSESNIKHHLFGAPGCSVVKRLPSAQVMIPGASEPPKFLPLWGNHYYNASVFSTFLIFYFL